ncbi:MAG: DUF4326 domain-containing protein [Salinarimonadaceae bacterium]|nr:MAG: DUF4326 domain-containing protein [Salinarimonadaceae bacterium]
MTRPVRIQLSRRRGFELQAASRALNGLPAVVVARPTRWGNPWRVGEAHAPSAAAAASRFRSAVLGRVLHGTLLSPNAHPESYIGRIIADAPRDLRGKILACWCAPGAPCHADALLELANGPICEEVADE